MQRLISIRFHFDIMKVEKILKAGISVLISSTTETTTA